MPQACFQIDMWQMAYFFHLLYKNTKLYGKENELNLVYISPEQMPN